MQGEIVEKLRDISSRTTLWLTVSVMITLGLIIGGQFNTSFSVYWAVQQLGISGKTFSYSMWGGIEKLLDAKTYFLAWALILFSGMWPIVKLICLLFAAVLPDHPLLTPSRRYTIISYLCQFGRWSFLDCWIVTLIVLTVKLDSDSLPGFNIAVWVQSVAEKGVALFLAGILSSQLISNVIVTLRNRRDLLNRPGINFNSITDDSDFAVLSSNDDPEGTGSMWSGVGKSDDKLSFRDKYLGISQHHTPPQTPLARGLVTAAQFLFVLLGLFVIIALCVPCLTITYTAALETFETRSYSFITAFTTIAYNNHPDTYTHSPSPILLPFFGVLLVVILPLIQVILSQIIWWMPMTLSSHINCHLVLDNVSHLASTDTFSLALIVVSAEIGSLLNSSELGTYVQVNMSLPGAFVFVTLVGTGFTVLIRFLLNRHRAVLLQARSLTFDRPLLQ